MNETRKGADCATHVHPLMTDEQRCIHRTSDHNTFLCVVMSVLWCELNVNCVCTSNWLLMSIWRIQASNRAQKPLFRSEAYKPTSQSITSCLTGIGNLRTDVCHWKGSLTELFTVGIVRRSRHVSSIIPGVIRVFFRVYLINYGQGIIGMFKDIRYCKCTLNELFVIVDSMWKGGLFLSSVPFSTKVCRVNFSTTYFGHFVRLSYTTMKLLFVSLCIDWMIFSETLLGKLKDSSALVFLYSPAEHIIATTLWTTRPRRSIILMTSFDFAFAFYTLKL